MEELLGFLIFAAIALVSLVGKLREQRKPSQETESEGPIARPEDLPEATRRMLFGDSMEPPLAVPRGESPPEPPVAVPRREPPPRQTPPPRRAVAPERPVPPLRAPAAPPRRIEPRPVLRPTAADVQRELRRTMQRALQQTQVRQAVRRPPPVFEEEHEGPPPEAPKPAQPTKRRRAEQRTAPLRGFLRDINDVRRGIILQEILGPPKSLRD